ncbi:hypothetical protein [uncultured Arcobacter sp.]|mgnify:CR=1 FL=1|uniref:hypothetical protein n=1 Tax=uncultured Arcobacter sp. TaxID=165434 RepID=UPI00262807FB|nr:hypothetical protein [uncultured Arcobacter sp.]
MKVTIYKKDEFFGSVKKIEANLVEHGRMKYAQYNSAPFVIAKPKRKRTAYRWVETFQPYMIIVKGWDAPAVDNPFVVTEKNDSVTISRTKYSSFDERYGTDFDKVIDAWIAEDESRLVADYRDSYQKKEVQRVIKLDVKAIDNKGNEYSVILKDEPFDGTPEEWKRKLVLKIEDTPASWYLFTVFAESRGIIIPDEISISGNDWTCVNMREIRQAVKDVLGSEFYEQQKETN